MASTRRPQSRKPSANGNAHPNPQPAANPVVTKDLTPKQRRIIGDSNERFGRAQQAAQEAGRTLNENFELVLDAHHIPESDYRLWGISQDGTQLIRQAMPAGPELAPPPAAAPEPPIAGPWGEKAPDEEPEAEAPKLESVK